MLRALYWRMAFAVIAIAAMLCFMLQSHGEWTDLDIPSDSTKLDHDAYDIPTSFNSPRGVHSSNASIPLLHKRILGQPVLPYDQMCDFIRAGKTFYNAIMFADIAGADVIFSQKLGPDRESTQWQRPNLGSQMGTMWTNTDISGTLGPSIASIRGCLEGLQVGVRPAGVQGQPWQVPRQVSTGIYPAGPNVGIRTVQDKPYGGQPQHQPTMGEYTTVFNFNDGVIIVQSAWAPAFMFEFTYGHPIQPAALPPYSRWSDLTFDYWMTYRRHEYYNGNPFPPNPSRPNLEGPMEQFLNWILIQGIKQPSQTLQIIGKCLFARGWLQESVPTWQQRERFEVGHWCFYALLATRNNYGIAWLLAQHKGAQGLGHKALKSVTIFAAQSDDLFEQAGALPCLLWEVVDYDNALLQLAQTTEGNLPPIQPQGLPPGQPPLLQPWALAQQAPFVARGCQIMDLMCGTIENADNFLGVQSQRNNIALLALRASGWKKTDASELVDLGQYRAVFQGLRGVQGYTGTNIPTQVDKPDQWVRSVMRQTEKYSLTGNVRDRDQDPTNAVYDSIWSAKNKAIIVLQAWGPKYMSGPFDGQPPKPDYLLPPVRQWSDITYVDQFLDKYPMRSDQKTVPFKWFLIQEITAPTSTLGIISYCLQNRYNLDHIPEWPGVTFAMGTDCFNALLASPNSCGIGWYLITHKFRFQNYALLSVTVFRSQRDPAESDGLQIPSLLWYGEPVTQKMRQQLNDNIMSNQQNPNQAPPWPLAPVQQH